MLVYAAAGANQRRLLLRRAAAGRLLKKLGRQDLSVLVAGLSAGRLAPSRSSQVRVVVAFRNSSAGDAGWSALTARRVSASPSRARVLMVSIASLRAAFPVVSRSPSAYLAGRQTHSQPS